MRKFLLAAGAAAALLAAPLLPSRAEAAPFNAAGINLAVQDLNLTETVQFVYRGRRHCWYPDGWRGPGWYWCGYRLRRGLGWGGPAGYRGWTYRGPGVVVRPGPRRRAPGPRVIIRP
ncbi:MAG: hypothetical protein GEU91_10100 [Rhizobiales bacterium]|nr:hypothetical protein [Hyphomicrobiales bacterium]